MKALLVACVALPFAVLGCTKKDPEPTKTEPAPSASVVPSAPPSAPSPANPMGDLSVSAIMEKLAAEAKNRPNANPTVEKVLAVVTDQLKIAIADKKQVAGFTSGAKYCVLATTKNDVHLAVCEYENAESATKGAEKTSVTNKVIKRREVLRKNGTTLAIQQSGESKEAEAEAKKVHDAFSAL